VGHEGVLKLTDLKDIFEDEGEDGAEGEVSEDLGGGNEPTDATVPEVVEGENKVEDSDSDEQEPEEHNSKKRKKKQIKDPMAKKRDKKGRNQIVSDPSFFSGL